MTEPNLGERLDDLIRIAHLETDWVCCGRYSAQKRTVTLLGCRYSRLVVNGDEGSALAYVRWAAGSFVRY